MYYSIIKFQRIFLIIQQQKDTPTQTELNYKINEEPGNAVKVMNTDTLYECQTASDTIAETQPNKKEYNKEIQDPTGTNDFLVLKRSDNCHRFRTDETRNNKSKKYRKKPNPNNGFAVRLTTQQYDIN